MKTRIRRRSLIQNVTRNWAHRVWHIMRSCAWMLVAALVCVPTLATPAEWPSKATDTTFYIGPNNGLWSTPGNWAEGHPPASGSDVIVGQFVPPRNGDVNVILDTNTPSLNSVSLDATGTTGSVILNQSDNSTAMSSTTEYVGISGHTAAYNHSGGSNTAGGGPNFTLDGIHLGEDAGSNGSYNLSGDGNVTGNFFIGNRGIGSFTQSGGTAYIYQLYISFNPGSSGSTYTLEDGMLHVGDLSNDPPEIIGDNDYAATFTQSGGTHEVGGLTTGLITIGVSSSYTLSDGDLLIDGGTLSANTSGWILNYGTLNLAGGNLTVTESGNPSGPMVIDNLGTVNYSGSNMLLFSGAVIQNTGTFNVQGNLTLPVAVNNTSAFNVTDSTVTYTDTFTNDGSYISDPPSAQYFTSMNIGTDAYVRGGIGDVFSFSGNITNNSSRNGDFDLTGCYIVLPGTGVTHSVTWPGADLGAVVKGYANNFATGGLLLPSGNSLTLLDGNPTQSGAIYTELLLLQDGVPQIANIATDGQMSIYYDPNNAANAYLGGDTYPLNGGGVIAPVPDRTPPPASPTPTPTATATPTATSTPTATLTPTPTPTPCDGRCSPTPRPRLTPRTRPTPPPHITPVPTPTGSPLTTPVPRPTSPPHITPAPPPPSPRPTPRPRP
jgi:hypothetical protein